MRAAVPFAVLRRKYQSITKQPCSKPTRLFVYLLRGGSGEAAV